MTAAGVTTWYDFAVAILDEASATPAGSSWLTAALRGTTVARQARHPDYDRRVPDPGTPASLFRPIECQVSESLRHRTA